MSCTLKLTGREFNEKVWVVQYSCVLDWLSSAFNKLGIERFGEFLIVAWECYNARNRYVLGNEIETYHHWVSTLSYSLEDIRRSERYGGGDFHSEQFLEPGHRSWVCGR